jgi:hypothetical protein
MNDTLMSKVEEILYERYAKLVLASKRAGMPFPTWEEYRTEYDEDWSTDE